MTKTIETLEVDDVLKIIKEVNDEMGVNFKHHICKPKWEDSTIIQWIYNDFRIGINIEKDPKESGWHLVSKKTVGKIDFFGEINICGSLNKVDSRKIIKWLLCFIDIFESKNE